MTTQRLVEYAPGQFGMLVRTGSDARTDTACATCGQPIGYAGMATRMGDEALVHFMADRSERGLVLDCVTGNSFRTEMA
jgi:hypothetical protein